MGVLGVRTSQKFKSGCPSHIELFTTQKTKKPSCRKGDARQCRHSKMAAVPRWPSLAILGIYRTGNSAIRSADPKNPSLEPNMSWIGCTVCEIFAFKLYCDLETGVRGHSRSSKAAPLGPRKPDPIEAKITSIGKTVASYGHFLYIQDGRQQPSWILSNRRPRKP